MQSSPLPCYKSIYQSLSHSFSQSGPIIFFLSSGRYIDYLSFTYATSKGKNIKSYTINTTFKKRENIKNINTLKPFKISPKVLMISSSHEVVTKRKVSIPSFLSWPPSIAHTLSHWIMRYIVQDGFCPWFR